MLLKQTLDGHVLSIATIQDHVISLAISNSIPTLSLSGRSSGIGSGDGQRETSGTVPLEENVFSPIVSYDSVVKIGVYVQFEHRFFAYQLDG